MSGNLLHGFTCDADRGFEVIETERGPIAPRPRLILEWAGESRRKERTDLADILSDGRFDVAASQRVRGFVVSSHLVSSFIEIKLALTLGQESQRAFHGGNVK